jgi:hypothetical protein
MSESVCVSFQHTLGGGAVRKIPIPSTEIIVTRCAVKYSLDTP